ncbi:Mitochondrial outer membrane protein porin [Neolecta irregularis DAH-3]|uniref:Mitochondrial outer membrane protein porin n=1 Tax=Neolecta irregularis (strain DAH-3) TaxID=1198029 RepID=A0A1U7LJ33_NEOID|nr:Mitochondrial outer membrane protein porin [Neolecta irregularis DAH-3]|eukprot:OLL22562.1 Mitochondrial outer membrane protein porin [Neolecta irregularis DAH-3]
MSFTTVPPNYKDIAKAASDLLSKDFPVQDTKLEIKTVAPNGVAFTVRGTQDSKIGSIAGDLETKYTDKQKGLSFTTIWNTAGILNSKVEYDDKLAKGLKLEGVTTYNPNKNALDCAKFSVFHKQAPCHARAFVNALKGPVINADVVIGSDGFVAGGEIAYNLGDGRITGYGGSVGYISPLYSLSVQASNNLKVFTASYYHRVGHQVEAAAKAIYDSKAASPGVALEVGSKYLLDPTTFLKGKINNSGIAAISYNQVLRPGVKVGVGAKIDTQNPQGPSHKVGMSFTFEG